MDGIDILIVVVVVALVVVLLWMFVSRNSPGRGNTETGVASETRDSQNDRLYRTADRPAGPDAEGMYVGERGSVGPMAPSQGLDPGAGTEAAEPDPSADPRRARGG